MLVRAQGSTDGGATWEWLKVDSDGHLQVDILSIAADSLLFKYDGQVVEKISDTSAAAGSNLLESTAVPAGKVQVITSVCAFDYDTAITEVGIGITVGGVYHTHNITTNPGIREPVLNNNKLILAAGNKIYASYGGCVLNDDLYLYVNGYQIAV